MIFISLCNAFGHALLRLDWILTGSILTTANFRLKRVRSRISFDEGQKKVHDQYTASYSLRANFAILVRTPSQERLRLPSQIFTTIILCMPVTSGGGLEFSTDLFSENISPTYLLHSCHNIKNVRRYVSLLVCDLPLHHQEPTKTAGGTRTHRMQGSTP